MAENFNWHGFPSTIDGFYTALTDMSVGRLQVKSAHAQVGEEGTERNYVYLGSADIHPLELGDIIGTCYSIESRNAQKKAIEDRVTQTT